MPLARLLIFIYCLTYASCSDNILYLAPIQLTESDYAIEASWNLSKAVTSLTLRWGFISYSSQETYKEIQTNTLTADAQPSTIIDYSFVFNKQFRVCLNLRNPTCDYWRDVCSYIRVPNRRPKELSGNILYLVIGPVSSKNITVTWMEIPPTATFGSKGYKITWRRVHGRVDHPGHSSNLISHQHVIRGLIPATRYKICVGEAVFSDLAHSCDFISTAEDVPGPPSAKGGSCRSQARGTHWRCDAIWSLPEKPNGNVIGYYIEWKDKEGFVLTEYQPSGTFCDPFCYAEQIVNFHPWEVCIRARTSIGLGWEDCAPIHDVSERIMAFFEFRVLLIIFLTLLVYQFGVKILRIILRCCIRVLYRHLEEEKRHPV